ncbi:hypothetical protein F4778DRAFT_784776 [Xylariomycetidae sp. FL2044]|nr:hypothetical protein F4778DRAFT_784776 [Xylariomycetidae sp. FL2044]
MPSPSLIEKLPCEVQISILSEITDLDTLYHVVSQSRKLYSVLRDNQGPISKKMIMNLIGTENYKLAVMAQATRGIDATNHAAVLRFLEDYIFRIGEWPTSLYKLAMVRGIQAAHASMDIVVSRAPKCEGFSVWKLGPDRLSRTERARLQRTWYLAETAANLFRWQPGPVDSERLHVLPPFPDLSRRFWSMVPRWDVYRLECLSWHPFLFMSRPPGFPDNAYGCHVCTRCGAKLPIIGAACRIFHFAFFSVGVGSMARNDTLRIYDTIEDVRDWLSDWHHNLHESQGWELPRAIFHHTSEATLVHPLPAHSPFYEENPGWEGRFDDGDMDSLRRFLRRNCSTANFLKLNEWIVPFVDLTRLPSTVIPEEDWPSLPT